MLNVSKEVGQAIAYLKSIDKSLGRIATVLEKQKEILEKKEEGNKKKWRKYLKSLIQQMKLKDGQKKIK